MNILRKQIHQFFGLVTLFSIFCFFTCLSFASSYEINLAQFEALPEHAGYRCAENFVNRVNELSDGRIKINHFPGDLLGDWETQEIHVKEGSLDMAMAPPSAIFDVEMEFVWIPYLVFNWEGAKDIYGPGGGGEKLLKEICQRNNTYCLGVFPGGFNVIVSTKEFTPSPGHETVKKLKTRIMPTKTEEITGKVFGFSTLSMSWGEIHGALLLGTIDAAMGPNYGESPLFKDVAKYLYQYNYEFTAAPWIINIDRWKSLPLEDQEIIQTAMTEAIAIEWEKGIETQDVAIAEMQSAGVKIVELTKEQMAANIEACRDVVWSWAADELYSEEFMNTIRSFAQPISTLTE